MLRNSTGEIGLLSACIGGRRIYFCVLTAAFLFVPIFQPTASGDTVAGIVLEKRTVGESLGDKVEEMSKIFVRMEALYSAIGSETLTLQAALDEINTIEGALVKLDREICACCDQLRMTCSQSSFSSVLLARLNEMEEQYHGGIKTVLAELTRLRDSLQSQSGAVPDVSFGEELGNLLDYIKKHTVEPPKIRVGGHEIPPPTTDLIPETAILSAVFSPAVSLQYQVYPEDLKSTVDAQITPRIQQLAAELNNDPVAIYNYVKGNIDYEPYLGSKKGSEGALIEKAGNAVDQASLLIALYRSIGIPCRYLLGGVQLSVEGAMNWQNAETVEGLMMHAEVGNVALDKDGNQILVPWKPWINMTEGERQRVLRDIRYVRVHHTWVEAYIPFFNYRGSPTSDASQKFWIQLDPSFKRYRYNERRADALSKLGFNVEELLAEYFHSDIDTPVDAFLLDRVGKAILKQFPDLTLADLLWDRKIVQVPVTQLPIGPDSGIVASVVSRELHEIPENAPSWFVRRATIMVDGITKTFRTPELYNKRITISFRPATPADEELLNQVGGDLLRVSPLYRMLTELKIEGNSVGIASTPRKMGEQAPYKFSTEPTTFDREVSVGAGGFYAVSVNLGYVPRGIMEERYEKLIENFDRPKTDLDATFGEMMYLAASEYWHLMQTGSRKIGRLVNISEFMLPSAAMVRVDIKAISHFNMPSGVEVNSLVIDVPMASDARPRGSLKEQLPYQKLNIVHASTYEHIIFDKMFDVKSLSTIKILQLAKAKGVDLVQITPLNKDAQLQKLKGNIPEDDFQAISEEANRPGLEFLLTPIREQVIGGWKGTGWLFFNPSYAFGAIISGKPFGGASTEPPPAYFMQDGGGVFIPDPSSGFEVFTWGNVQEIPSAAAIAWLEGNAPLPQGVTAVAPIIVNEPPPPQIDPDLATVSISFLDITSTGEPDDPIMQALKLNLREDLGIGSSIYSLLSGDPVDISSGQFFNEEVDLVVPGRMPIVIKRIYKSRSSHNSFLGHGWMFGYDGELFFKDGNVVMSDYDGGVLEFVRQGTSNTYLATAAANPGFVNETVNGIGGATSLLTKKIEYIPAEDAFVYTDGRQERRRFTKCGGEDPGYLLRSIDNIHGDSIVFTCDEISHRVIRIENSSGNFVTLHYNANGFVQEILLNDGRRIQYVIDQFQDMVGFVNPNGDQTSYVYESKVENGQSVSTHRLISVRRPANRRVDNEYDAEGRVLRQLQTFGNNATPVFNATFTYNADNTIVTDFAGKTTTYFFDAQKRITRVVDATGASVSKTWDANGNLTAVTDANNRMTTMTYDTHGNILTPTDAKGGVTRYTYEPTFHKVTSAIDANGHKMEYVYDVKGNLIEERRFTGTQSPGYVLYLTTAHTYDAFGQRTSTTEPEGGVTRFEYDNAGNLARVTDALGNVTTHTYDQRGNRTSTTDPLGNVTNVEYDILNRPTAAADPLGGRAATTFDANGNVLSVTNPNGHATASTYDYADRQLAVTDALGGVTKNEYSQSNKLIASTDPRGNATRVFYDDVYRLLRVQDALSGNTPREYDPAGNVIKEIDARGNATQHVYDELNRRIKTIDAEGNVTSVEYDATGNATARVDGKGNRTTYFYDELNRLIKVTGAQEQSEEYTYNRRGDQTSVKNKRGFVTVFEYDLMRRLVKQMNPDGSIMRYEYDALGRRTAVIDNNNNRTETVYDKNGRVISVKDAIGNMTTYAYDPNGNRVSQTDANGNVITFTYDALNRLTSKTEGGNITTQYVYDANGNQTAVVDANGNRTEHTFDALNRRVSVKDALGNLTRYTPDVNGNQTEMTNANNVMWRTEYDKLNRAVKRTDPVNNTEEMVFDPAGNLLAHKDAKGQAVVNEFDALNRLVRKKLLTTLFVTIRDRSWQELTAMTGHVFESYTFDPNGNRLTMTDSTGLTTYDYDNMDRVITQTQQPAGLTTSLTTRYSYDGLGNRRVLEYPDGKKVFYDYDKLNRLETVKDNDGAVTCRTTFDNVGLTRTKLYANSTLTEYQYDNLYRVTSVTNKRLNGEVISRFDYQYDAVGNRLRQIETSGGQTNVTVYTYDQTYRLTLESDNKRTIEYFFDAVGNRIKTITNKDTIDVYIYNERNELLTITTTSIISGGASKITTFTYDANGNTIRKQSPTTTDEYRYDIHNRLVTVINDSGTIRYTYNGAGGRGSRDDNGVVTVFVGDGPNYIAEAGTDGVLISKTVFGVNPVSRGPPNSAAYFFQYDGVGSVVNLTNAAGNAVASYRYSAFGEILSENESIAHPNPYRYVAREYEHRTGLYDMRRRHYDPRIGRFISADPYLGSGYDPRTLHRYTYAFSSPTRFGDPSGYVTQEFGDWSDAGTVVSMKILYPPATGYDPMERHAAWSYNTRIIGLEGTLRSFVRGADLYLDEAAASIYRLSGTEGGRQSATLIEADVNRRLDQLSPAERYVTERAKEGIDQFVFLGSVFFPFAWEGRAAGEVVNLTGRAATRSGYEIMQQLTTNAAERLAQNPGLAARYLSGGEYAAGQASARIANLQYGNAIERMVAADIEASPELRALFKHVSQPGKAVPDFVGQGPFKGMTFDITTTRQVEAHLARPYGRGLDVLRYERPLTFTTFPR